ncbi:MAG: hypothetical protein SYR96_21835 [Actinomycetota bacterium]|nr:hypothetical protein [Actinomycetota bacterium]
MPVAVPQPEIGSVLVGRRVREAAVIGVAGLRWGERPIACVVPADGVPADAG